MPIPFPHVHRHLQALPHGPLIRIDGYGRERCDDLCMICGAEASPEDWRLCGSMRCVLLATEMPLFDLCDQVDAQTRQPTPRARSARLAEVAA